MTTTTLRIVVLLVAIVAIYLLVKLYLHILRSRVIPAIEPELGEEGGTPEPAGAAPEAEPDEDAEDGATGEAESGGDDLAGG